MAAAARHWLVYILECSDSTLYTGITSDLEKRLEKHYSGAGAKYTRGRGPYRVLYTERLQTKGLALKREAKIKKLRRKQKLLLISDYSG
jgi:predicted GIY-YIG superfamily endonuclease